MRGAKKTRFALRKLYEASGFKELFYFARNAMPVPVSVDTPTPEAPVFGFDATSESWKECRYDPECFADEFPAERSFALADQRHQYESRITHWMRMPRDPVPTAP